MIIISDESGCHGVSYQRGSSQSYITSMVCFATNDSLLDFVNTSKILSRRHLSTRLRKWSKLPSAIKNNPERLENFIDELFSTLHNHERFFVFSFFMLGKKAIETGHRPTDMQLIKLFSKNSYSYCLKRIFPFIRKMNYVLGYYRAGVLPTTEWYIDINNKNFRKELQDSVSKVDARHIELTGPMYIAKNDTSRREILDAIKIIDIIGGITSRAFNLYSTNCETCNTADCFSNADCNNQYIKVWQKIVNYTANVEIMHQGEEVWHWNGIIYAPFYERTIHSRFFGTDDFFT